MSSSLERQIIQILNKEKIQYSREKTFTDLKKGKYRFDFYLPNWCGRPILIEIDGAYHFKPIRGIAVYKKQCEHDRRKNSWALAHKIELYRIPYWDMDRIKSIKDIIKDCYLVKSKWHNDNLIKNK